MNTPPPRWPQRQPRRLRRAAPAWCARDGSGGATMVEPLVWGNGWPQPGPPARGTSDERDEETVCARGATACCGPYADRLLERVLASSRAQQTVSTARGVHRLDSLQPATNSNKPSVIRDGDNAGRRTQWTCEGGLPGEESLSSTGGRIRGSSLAGGLTISHARCHIGYALYPRMQFGGATCSSLG